MPDAANPPSLARQRMAVMRAQAMPLRYRCACAGTGTPSPAALIVA
ncbi:MAG TPA: hypothetical protein PLD10_20755 [Rhodopila sp.]|nr:hypothetical protein [Rhodopila sp.]